MTKIRSNGAPKPTRIIISTTGERWSVSGRPYPTTADLNTCKKKKKNQINRAVERMKSIDALSEFIF